MARTAPLSRMAAARRPAPWRGLGVALATALLAAACAAPLRIEANADPLAILQGGSLVYARLSGEASRQFAAAALPPAAAKALVPVLARTRVLALGLGSADSKAGLDPPSLQASLIGDFPFRAAALSLGSDPGWKRQKNAFFNARLGLRAAVPGPNLVLASTGALEPLLAAARQPGPSPIPQRFSSLASSELVFWVPEPFAGLGSLLLGEAIDAPATGLFIAANPVEGGKSYEATIVFTMRDERALRVYRPLLRLAWRGMAGLLFGAEGDAGGALGAEFAAEGDSYIATGVRISSSALAGAFSRLAAKAGEPQKPN